jgi:hypothetical protein
MHLPAMFHSNTTMGHRTMKTLPLLAALGLFGFASTAWGFGPPTAAVQSHRILNEPRVCVPRLTPGECDRMEVRRGDSNESERRIARLSEQDRRLAQAPAPQRRDRR